MDSPNDRVSVIIPTFNRAHLLPMAIESVRRQTHPDVEVIVADDGSDDGTDDMVMAMEGVRYLRQENRGPSAARNLGLSVASGGFVHFLDSDDALDPGFLEQSVAQLKGHPEAGLSVANGRRINEKGEIMVEDHFTGRILLFQGEKSSRFGSGGWMGSSLYCAG